MTRTDLRFEHGGVALAYDDLGTGGAPALVLIHGGSGSRESWTEVAAALVPRHRILAVDLAGHGDSDRAPGSYSVPDQGARIAALCEQVAAGDTVLIGHSFGALVAAYVAAVRPDVVRAAVLGDPPMYIMDPAVWPSTMFGMFFPLLRAAMEEAHRSDDPVAGLRSWIQSLPVYAERLGPDGVERFARSWAKCDPAVLGSVDDPAVDKAVWADHDPDTPIACPVLVVRADPGIMPAFYAEHEERFRRAAPGARFVLAEGCSHSIHDEQPGWLAEQVETFLASR